MIKFLTWVNKNSVDFGAAIQLAISSEPEYFNCQDGRFVKDKLHFRSIEVTFKNKFLRVEDSIVDGIFNSSGEKLSLKSQRCIFQRNKKLGNGLTLPRPVVIINTNSTYYESDIEVQRNKITDSVDFFVLYQPETLEQPFTLGVISSDKVAKNLKESGSQLTFRIPNAEYNFFFEHWYKFPVKDQKKLNIIYWTFQNKTFDTLLSA